ncbi:DUF397 domain-containing protein [Amycolatopsis sp. CA-230715]|uniref:DUF397 domain-containing protein n=1 Tax=Amycolatopsis sp. CA-230715 TaxID=2745196 RepID=UPI001C02F78A
MQVSHRATSLRLSWVKSSYSGTQANCVEVACVGEAVLVRDSKEPLGGRCASRVRRLVRCAARVCSGRGRSALRRGVAEEPGVGGSVRCGHGRLVAASTVRRRGVGRCGGSISIFATGRRIRVG